MQALKRLPRLIVQLQMPLVGASRQPIFQTAEPPQSFARRPLHLNEGGHPHPSGLHPRPIQQI